MFLSFVWGRGKSIIQLNKFTSNEAYIFLSKIPSDNESVTSGAPLYEILLKFDDYVPICDEFVYDLNNENGQYVSVDYFKSEDDLLLEGFKMWSMLLQFVHFKKIVVPNYRMKYNLLLTYSYAGLLEKW